MKLISSEAHISAATSLIITPVSKFCSVKPNLGSHDAASSWRLWLQSNDDVQHYNRHFLSLYIIDYNYITFYR